MSLEADKIGAGYFFRAIGLFPANTISEGENEGVRKYSEEDIRKLAEAKQRSGFVYNPPKIDDAIKKDLAKQYADLHHLFHVQAGTFSSLSPYEQIASLDIRDVVSELALNGKVQSQPGFATLAKATAVLSAINPNNDLDLPNRKDLYPTAKKFLLKLAGQDELNLRLAERLMTINKEYTLKLDKNQQQCADDRNTAAKLLEALIAKVEGRTLAISRNDLKMVDDLIERKFSTAFKSGDGTAIKAYELTNWLSNRAKDSYTDKDILGGTKSTLRIIVDDQMTEMNFFLKFGNAVKGILEEPGRDLNDLMKNLSKEIKNKAECLNWLSVFLGQVVRCSDDDSIDKRNAQLLADLIDQKIEGKSMNASSGEELNTLKGWAHKFFKDNYQNGTLLAQYALELVEQVKVL